MAHTSNIRDLPASYFYDIPTGGARPNEWFEKPSTYLSTLGAQRTEYPPVNWEDQPAKLAMNPDMLKDPAFSEYDLSNIRTFEQDPRLRDELDLGIVGTKSASKFARSPDLHLESAGFTYTPGFPYDPNKVYIDKLNELKMAVGPLAEQEKQGIRNKELASTIAHEFRHNLFKDPKYSGIIDAAYDRFGGWEGNISRFDLEEMINRAADVQLMPESWLGETLEDYEDEYNEMLTDPESWIENEERMGRHVPSWKKRELIARKMPKHLTTMNTTKQFHRAAKEFFEKVRREKLKRPTQLNIRKQEIGMPEHLTPPPKGTYTPPRGGGADVMPIPPPKKTYVSPARPPAGYEQSGGSAQDRGPPGGDPGWKGARGGYVDRPLPGRSRYL